MGLLANLIFKNKKGLGGMIKDKLGIPQDGLGGLIKQQFQKDGFQLPAPQDTSKNWELGGDKRKDEFNENLPIGSNYNNKLTTMAGGRGQHVSLTMDLLRKHEGYRAKPYWDVNAHRIGYGSDTITRADGQVTKVKPGMQITRADAERDLARRIPQFQNRIIQQVGDVRYQRFDPRTKAALISVTYNYGSLPQSVVKAAKTGNVKQIAQAIIRLQSHNKGINRRRRIHEARYMLGG